MLQTSVFDSAAPRGLHAPARLLTPRTHATSSARSDAGRSRTAVRLWIIQGVPAALGLAIIMIGATTITMLTATVAQALVPFVVGVLAVHVAYSRRRLLAAPRVQA